MAALHADELSRLTTPARQSRMVGARYADAREVLGDSARFSNDSEPPVPRPAGAGEEGTGAPRSLLLTDPPEHTRLRRLLSGEFTMRRIRRLEQRITGIVESCLDAMAAGRPPVDLVQSFTLPVPSLVICELLGVPHADRPAFQDRTARLLDLGLPPLQRQEAAAESRAYMVGLVDRAAAAPGDEIIGMLLREHGEDISRAELVSIATLLLGAGHETTANSLALGVLALLRSPDQLASVREDPAAAAAAVEELLRYTSVLPAGVPRRVVRDTTIGGQPVRAGDLVVVSLPTADRDPALLAAPDRLDVTRRPVSHVAFGYGVHHCLGAPLARLEMAVALPALLRRFPRIALAVPDGQVAFRSASLVHGLHALPVTW